MTPISFKRHRFPPDIVQHADWLYARFALSFRDVEDMLAEPGIDVSNETVRRWFLKFGRLTASNLRRSRPRPSANWHVDEMVIRIRDRKYRLWRAVGDEGEVLDFLVQRRRYARSARRLLRKVLKKQRFAPTRITTDKLKSYSVAIRKERLTAIYIQGRGRTIGRKTHTSRFDAKNENSSGSSRLGPLNASCRSMPHPEHILRPTPPSTLHYLQEVPSRDV